MNVLGFDPGATIGWGLVELDARGVATFLNAGDARDVEALVAFAFGSDEIPTPDLVAIEQVSRVVPRDRFSAVMATAISNASFVAGYLAASAFAVGVEHEQVAANEWRKALVCNGQASDAAIKAALQLRVQRLPKVTNAHERDALGVAVFAGLRAMRKAAP